MSAVASRNPFALLNDDDEPVAPVAASTATPVTATLTANAGAGRGNNERARGRGDRGARRGNGYPRRGGLNAPAEDGFSTPNPNEPGQRFDGERARGRGRGGRGRGGRGRGEGPRNGRLYDKQSQTNHVDSDKQVAQGWGAETGEAELQAEAEGLADAKAEGKTADLSGWDASAAAATTAEGWDAPAVAAGEAAGAEAKKEADVDAAKAVEEEVDNTLTLDEYLAKKKADEASALPQLEARRVEHQDGQWKDAVQLLREDNEDVYFAGKSKASAPRSKIEKAGKVFIDFDVNFERPEREGGRGRGRGGRGRGEGRGRGDFRGRGEFRGRGGRGEGRRGGRGGAASNVASFNVDDQAAFPTLG